MDTTGQAVTLLANLEATPLLGQGLERAKALRRQLTLQLTSHPEPALQLRAQLCFGELLLVLDAPDAAAFLLEQARLAEVRTEPALALRAQLLAVRACCRQGDLAAAQALLARCLPALPSHPQLRLDGLLARAWPGPIDAVALLLEALERLPPQRDHDRLAALLELADRCEEGGDPYRARAALEQALALAYQHRAHGPAARAALLLGSLQLRTGELDPAARSLDSALALATQAGDSLVRCTAGLLVSTLQLSRGDWSAVLATTEPLLALARQRSNPALLASLTLDRATALWATDRPVDSLAALMACSVELAPHPQPLELIRARFAELLEEVGAERFGVLVGEAAARLRS
jgi:tetratricopeptide (TPR) repeat protein